MSEVSKGSWYFILGVRFCGVGVFWRVLGLEGD